MSRHFSGWRLWPVSFFVCAAVTLFAFTMIDVPVARSVSPLVGRLQALGDGLGSAVLLSLEALTVMILVLSRLVRGDLPAFGEALALACLSSICAYGINSSVLKYCFGVPNPSTFLQGAAHAVHLWKGTQESSFPSGHMVLAGAFAGVFMRLYRASVWPLGALLLVAASLLVLGDWHFVSDVVAGGFLGISAGLLAGELWRVHSAGKTPHR